MVAFVRLAVGDRQVVAAQRVALGFEAARAAPVEAGRSSYEVASPVAVVCIEAACTSVWAACRWDEVACMSVLVVGKWAVVRKFVVVDMSVFGRSVVADE